MLGFPAPCYHPRPMVSASQNRLSVAHLPWPCLGWGASYTSESMLAGGPMMHRPPRPSCLGGIYALAGVLLCAALLAACSPSGPSNAAALPTPSDPPPSERKAPVQVVG